eukprot:s2724_g6.t1
MTAPKLIAESGYAARDAGDAGAGDVGDADNDADDDADDDDDDDDDAADDDDDEEEDDDDDEDEDKHEDDDDVDGVVDVLPGARANPSMARGNSLDSRHEFQYLQDTFGKDLTWVRSGY